MLRLPRFQKLEQFNFEIPQTPKPADGTFVLVRPRAFLRVTLASANAKAWGAYSLRAWEGFAPAGSGERSEIGIKRVFGGGKWAKSKNQKGVTV
jgi:hypothetical protein